MRILVADDDAQLQRALRITLASRGYDVVAAHDGAQAIELAAGATNIALLGLNMRDGLKMKGRLRRKPA